MGPSGLLMGRSRPLMGPIGVLLSHKGLLIGPSGPIVEAYRVLVESLWVLGDS